MSNLTPERLAEIERRANAATPGPWLESLELREDLHSIPVGMVRGPEGDLIAVIFYPEQPQKLADGEFITAARTAVPDLLAEVRRLRAERDTCIQALDAAANGCQMKEGKSADTSSGLIFRARASAFRMAANLIRRGGR